MNKPSLTLKRTQAYRLHVPRLVLAAQQAERLAKEGVFASSCHECLSFSLGDDCTRQ